MALSQDGTAYTRPVPKALLSRLISSSIGPTAQQAAMPILSAQSIPSGICRLQLAGECATFPGADESTSVPIDCQSIATSYLSLSVSAVANKSGRLIRSCYQCTSKMGF